MNVLVWPKYDTFQNFLCILVWKKCVYVKEYTPTTGQAVLMSYLETRKWMNLVSKNLEGLTSLQLTDW